MPNKTLIFKKVPNGWPVAGEHLAVEDRPFDQDAAAPSGGLTAEVLYASFDPYLRGRMRDAGVASYSAAFELNGPFVNGTVARILKSENSDFKAGDIIVGYTPIAEYVTIPEPAKQAVRKIDNPHNLDLALFLGPLGMPGLTAWSGLYKIGKPKAGETIFISSAAGAVGQVVGQIAKHEGLTVIGSVGSDEKLDFITKELGFNAGFNYKKEKPQEALARLAPKGIDIYFENVGGEHLEAALNHMNANGRIPVCGMISEYNKKPEERTGIQGLTQIVTKTLALEGFLVNKPGFGDAHFKDQQERGQKWISEGSFKPKLHITDGIDNAAEGFIGMLRGDNFGKAVLKIKA
ncbi:uncharacterized protein BCR38DRAFT_398136 [Pseudomassariella vexata]|uniref:Dehydrogenase FUB6 n=1 Tax=Pseudomassariella vexata TaxID=1141098 RepID=A0A1Y2DLA6_9PEZI|nr:uncharacterized protein BCR38DRAFT_398136 [Pseudomassariella vexata]ORY60060.1 hypothetical protein BCR38DRAFT_398136 [Pseudomassariella vexata]